MASVVYCLPHCRSPTLELSHVLANLFPICNLARINLYLDPLVADLPDDSPDSTFEEVAAYGPEIQLDALGKEAVPSEQDGCVTVTRLDLALAHGRQTSQNAVVPKVDA